MPGLTEHDPDLKNQRLDDVGAAPLTPGEQAELDQIEAGIKSGEPDYFARDAKTGSYYKNPDEAAGAFGRLGKAMTTRKGKVIAGSGGVLTVLIVFAISIIISMLGNFRLDLFDQNIEHRRLRRITHMFDKRSDRFIKTMITAEVAGNEAGDLNNNRYFTAKGWYASSNPFTQWYKDMKVNGFFDRLEEKYGMRFMRQTDGTLDRLVAININRLNYKIDFSQNGVLDLSNLTDVQLRDFERRITDVFDHNKDARRFFNKVVKEETKSWQVIKRHNLRKWARETLGITKWRFFENTREDARKKVRQAWTNTVSRFFKTGNALTCVGGNASACPDSDSLNDPDTKELTNTPKDSEIAKVAEDSLDDLDAPDAPSTPDVEIKGGHTSKIIKKIAGKLIPFLNIVDTVGFVKGVDDILGDKRLSKLVSVARAAEYATAYLTFATMIDQNQEAKSVSGEELDAALEMLQGAEYSDGYQNLIGDKPTVALSSNKVYAQGEEEEYPYAKITDNLKVNSDNTNASKIEQLYDDTIGKIIGPLMDALDKSGVDWLIDKFNEIAGRVLEVAADIGKGLAEALTGVDFDDVVRKVFEQFVSFLGGTPVCTGEESGGQLFNCIDGGAVVTASQFMQGTGGKLLDTATVQNMDRQIALEDARATKERGVKEKLFGLSSPNSLLAQIITRVPSNFDSISSKTMGTIMNLDIRNIISGIFSKLAILNPAYAQENVDDGNELYGVGVYGFTDLELDVDPFTPTVGANCEEEKTKWQEAIDNGNENVASLCTADEVVANSLRSVFIDEGEGGGGNYTPINGVECPANMTDTISIGGFTYYRMPESPTGEYTIYSNPARRYGSQQLVCALYTVAKKYKQMYGASSSLHIGDLNGGSPHVSHKWGIAVDVDAIGDIWAGDWRNGGDKYNTEATINLGKMFVDTGIIKNIWWCEPGSRDDSFSGNDGSMNTIREYAQSRGTPVYLKCIWNSYPTGNGHTDHFHVDIKDEFRGPAYAP